ncbi:MAG: hypothetical protein ACXVXC_14120 [Nocardioidaceae bacterium]
MSALSIDAPIPTLSADQQARMTAAVQARAARRTRELTDLLQARPDLVGAHAPADFAVEAFRWAV